MIKKNTISVLVISLGLLLSATSFLNASDNTTVYKAIAKDGSVSFSDEAQQGAEAIKIKPLTTIPAIVVKQNKTLITQDQTATKKYYQSLSIVSPENNAAFNTGSGNVNVVVESLPKLRNTDAFQLELDGSLVSTQKKSTFNLVNLSRGMHTLTVKIIDQNNQILEAAISSLTVHRPIQRKVSP